MDRETREALQAAGYEFGDAEDFLGLNEEERAMVRERIFHSRRRMFAVISGEAVIGMPNDERSHKEWLRQDYGFEKPCLRGYVDHTGLYFYSTDRCEAQQTDWVRVRPLLPYLTLALDLPGDLPIHEGTVPGPAGTRWAPARTLGKLGDFLR